MARHNVRGVESNEEVSTRRLRPDTRRLSKRADAYFQTTDGVIAAMMGLPAAALVLAKVPLASELILLAMVIFYRMYVSPGKAVPRRGGVWWLWDRVFETTQARKFDFPYRVPQQAKAFDGSLPREGKGKGISYLGREISTKLEIWSSDSDLRTHMLVLGTTGSGKTEFLLGLVYNALMQNSGFIYTDGKGDVNLWKNVFRLARYLGREGDLLLLNFLTSGRDFLDKQKDRTTNTMNPFALGSSGMMIELIISLMDDSGGGGDMWKGRAIAFVAGLTRALTFLRDRGYLLLDANTFITYMSELSVIETMVWDKKIPGLGKEIQVDDPLFEKVLSPLKAFILTLPGYKKEAKGSQEQKTLEQYGFITMQLLRLFSDLSYTYGYLFQTSLGEVDMYDVVINRRILVVLLPALERAPDSLKMLGKMIVGAIKQMMAGCLGNRVEGAVREIVDARPTNAAVPYYVVLDEYGYYAVLGFAVAPAQARSLGFPQPESARIQLADGAWTTMGEVQAGTEIRLPTGASARVREVLEHGLLPVSRISLCNGRSAEAANVHHWPTRCNAQYKLLTTFEIKLALSRGEPIELSYLEADGAIAWCKVESVLDAGIRVSKCLVVDHPMHCYITDDQLVTHNCITFAAQDFSSLQKASKEEADATWENTNVRAVGRLTSGRESETFRRIDGVADEAQIFEEGGMEYVAGELASGYRSQRDVRVTSVRRIRYDDLAHQQDGEFHFLIGKKQDKGGSGVRIIRGMGFYTQTFDPKTGKEERPSELRVNHFLKVAPPQKGAPGNDDVEFLEALEESLLKLLVTGKIKESFPDDPAYFVKNQKIDELFKVSHYIRSARDEYKLSMGEAIRAALVCCETEAGIQAKSASQRASELSATPQRASVADTHLAATAAALREEPGAVAVVEAQGPAFAESLANAPTSTAIESAEQPAVASIVNEVPTSVEVADLVQPAPVAANIGETPTRSVRVSFDDEEDLPAATPASAPAVTPAVVAQVVVEVESPPPTLEASIAAAVTGYVDSYDTSALQKGGDKGGASSGEPVRKVSLLSLRPLGDDEEPPSVVSSYLETSLVDVELALGSQKDPIAAHAEAKKDVKTIEHATGYVQGTTPDPVSLDDFDSAIDALAEKAETYRPDFM